METKSAINKLKAEFSEIISGCRVCMGWSVNMQPIFNPEDHSIVENVEFCTGLKLTSEEGLPSNICDSCLQSLSIAHTFKKNCLNSDRALRNLDITSVKTENDSDEGDARFDCSDDDEDILHKMLKLNDVKVESESEDIQLSDAESKPAKERRLHNYKMKRNKTIKEKRTQKRGPYKKRDPNRNTKLKKLKFRRLYCEACDLKFTTKDEHLAHKEKMHNNLDSVICELCGKIFTNKTTFYSHARAHLPPAFACARCDYRSHSKHDLTKHVRIHTGQKLFQCQFCSQSYYTSSNLSSHIRRSHEMLRPHRCHLCDKAFYDRNKLNRHVDSHNDVKRFECEYCHSCYTRRCYWKKHLLKQHGVALPAQRPGRRPLNLLMSMGESHGNSFSAFTKAATKDTAQCNDVPYSESTPLQAIARHIDAGNKVDD